VNRWKTDAVYAPTPRAAIMYASCEIVEYARTRLMSSCTRASSAAINIVIAAMTDTTLSAAPACSNTTNLYWSIAQQIAHLTANGASLRTGDLLATGTISGPAREERGSLIELSWTGSEPIELPDGSTRTVLEDGDEVVLRGEPLGEVRGRIEPALSS
jgi:hypothetical protein